MKINFTNVELSEEYPDDVNISYWVSGQLQIDNFLYDIQGSIDSWDSLDFLNTKFSEDSQITEDDFENKENGMKDTFETNSNSYIINIEASAIKTIEGLPSSIQMYNTPYFDPYSDLSLDDFIKKMRSNGLSRQDLINSILKATFIDWFSNFIELGDNKTIYSIKL